MSNKIAWIAVLVAMFGGLGYLMSINEEKVTSNIVSDVEALTKKFPTGDEITLFRPLDMYDFLDVNPNIDINVFKYFDDYTYWNGIDNGFPKESSITDIFILDTKDLSNYCVFEFNCWDVEGGSILDSSGVGNKGILIGDYAITKDAVGSPVKRDSALVKPVVGFEDGAF